MPLGTENQEKTASHGTKIQQILEIVVLNHLVGQLPTSVQFFLPLCPVHPIPKMNDYWYLVKKKSLSIFREFMADSVIQATGTVEFEDGLRMVVHLGGCWGP